MGFDDLPSPKADENAEITIEVPGNVDPAAFAHFKAELKKCLAALGASWGTPGPPAPGKPRWVRVSIRKKS